MNIRSAQQNANSDIPNCDRAWWIGVLARAKPQDVASILEAFKHQDLSHDLIKRPETGTVMLEGRAGGTGQRFNVGEATVTRCVVRVSSGTIGVAYALGRDKVKAEHSALIDALLQSADNATRERILAQLFVADNAYHESVESKSRKAAATKVNFFTLVRGEG